MIVRMKEIWLFVLTSSVDQAVQELGELGVVDIKEVTVPQGSHLELVSEKVERAESAIAILENYAPPSRLPKDRKKYSADDPTRVTNRILFSGEFRKRCQSALTYLNRQVEWFEIWGADVELQDFDYLRSKGIYVRLYVVDKNEVNNLPSDLHIVTFPERDGKVPVALFARSEMETLPYHEEPLPVVSLAEAQRQIARKKRQLEEVDLYLADHAENISFLQDYHAYWLDRLKTRKALEGMGDIEGSVKYLKGFIPHTAVEMLKAKAEQQSWGYQISEPEQPEEVPVYIKNPKWIEIINPVLKFIDIVPGYKEVDVSIYFLFAFALFFAMLVGDAGYGLLFLLGTLLFGRKLSAQVRALIYVLSGTTVIWGVLSGTYFGSERIAAIPFLNDLIIPEIASFGVDNISFMMHLSFLIGAIHLTIAHLVRVVKYINSIKVLSEIGWILFVWGLFFVAEKLVLGKDLPAWSTWLFVGGAVLVAFFSKEGKTFLGSLGTSLGNLPLSLINGFSDIVSYVRLFAVGMATATVASSFNNMILPEGVDKSFLGLIMAAVALLLGHGLNIILALMAVMVHGIRLNMLEFSGHLGVEFSGEEYRPFQLNASNQENGTSEELEPISKDQQ
jgi:V/A-type H+-transporting ATPase subunit I